MLVATLSPGKALKIGDNVVIRVLKAHRGKLRLGIEAPESVQVVRDDVKGRELIKK